MQRLQGLNGNLGRPKNFELLHLLRQATPFANFLEFQFESQFNIHITNNLKTYLVSISPFVASCLKKSLLQLIIIIKKSVAI